MRVLVKYILSLAIYITVWSFDSRGQSIAQVASIAMFALVGLLGSALVSIERLRISMVEAVLLAASFYSTMVGLITGSEYVWQFSITVSIVVIGIGIVSRALTSREIAHALIVAYVGVVMTQVGVDNHLLLEAFRITVTEQGLLRYSPIGMHPNLTGLVYGVFTILCIAWLLSGTVSIVSRAIAFGFIVLGVVGVLGASARASVVALFVAVPFLLIKEKVLSGKRAKIAFIALVTVVLVVAVLKYDDIADWLWVMLDLNSESRGFGSGGTGRVDLWKKGLALLSGNAINFWFGGGFRSTGSDVIGFNLESSYINILLELGIFVGLVVIAAFFKTIMLVVSIDESREKIHSNYLNGAAAVMIYVVVQSVFNRYLLAIGNPASLVFLVAVISCSVALGEGVTKPNNSPS